MSLKDPSARYEDFDTAKLSLRIACVVDKLEREREMSLQTAGQA